MGTQVSGRPGMTNPESYHYPITSLLAYQFLSLLLYISFEVDLGLLQDIYPKSPPIG